MIRTQEMVPDFYIEKSRDFQILCRLYDYTLNGLKYNIDTMTSLTDTRAVKDTVLPLVGDKFGIYDKEAYTNRQLLEALPIALKYKGSLKSIKILLNAFLDSMEIFDYAIAYHSKDVDSATEISEILNRKVDQYSVVIILSTFPNLTNLHTLDEYMKMVLPTGMKLEYSFGVMKTYLDKFKYNEYTFLYYTKEHNYGTTESPNKMPYIGFVKNAGTGETTPAVGRDIYNINLRTLGDTYDSAFTYFDYDRIVEERELIVGKLGETVQFTPKHTPTPASKTSLNIAFTIFRYDKDTLRVLDQQEVIVGPSTFPYNITLPDSQNIITYVSYHCNREAEFIEDKITDVDINSVGLATIEIPESAQALGIIE